MKRLLLCFLAVSLSACQEPDIPAPLPLGEQTIQGILRPAELSIVRRGTHVLEIEGTEKYFAESTVVNLRGYEQKLVTLRGTLETNIELDAYPVLVVDSVVDVESSTTDWYIGFLDLTITTPRTWSQKASRTTAHFFIEDVSELPVLTLSQEAGVLLPEGTSVVVDGHPAIRITDEQMGSQTITVQRNDKLLMLIFSPRFGMDMTKIKSDWLSALQSIDLTESTDRIDTPTTSTGSTRRKPCGGIAGILCDSGYYCEITNIVENIGSCKKV